MTEHSETTLVVIDDDPDVLHATARILLHAGYQVITGASVAEALELTRRHLPALLLLDVMLPDGNGVDVARQLKSEPALAGVRVILLSGIKTSGEDQAAGLTIGLADGYIARPFSKPEFLARIDAMLRLRSAQVELEQHRNHLQKLVFARTAELALARDVAEAANRAKSIFLTTMSHELRTPMNVIMGMTDLALSRATDPQQIKWLNESQGSARQLLAIISNILDISRMEAEHLTLKVNDFSLAQLIDAALRAQGEAARAKGLGLSASIDPALPDLLLGDAPRLRQVLTNFIGNAVKFSERGQIAVRASAAEIDSHGVLLRIEVSDQGIGISPEERARLFQPYTQADGSSTRKHGGAGLGLIIAKRLAMLMDGEVGVDSTPGCGSTFWFTARLQRGHGVMPGESATLAGAAPDSATDSHGSPPDAVMTGFPELPANDDEVAEYHARALKVLEQLQPLLSCDDTASAELFEANRPLLLATHGAGAMQLGRQIGDFDYPTALATLRELMLRASEV